MQAYSMFPGRGFNVKPMFITRIEDRNGNVLESFMPQRKEVINDVTAYEVVNMMQGVVRSGTGRRMWSYGVQGEIAGKTGTTNDNSDAWFMGYTPQLIAGVWTGCDDRFIRFASKAGEGSSASLPIWAYFYAKAAADRNTGLDPKSTFVKPENFTPAVLDYEGSDNVDFGAEADNTGNGEESDYTPAPQSNDYYIAPESQIQNPPPPREMNVPLNDPKKQQDKPKTEAKPADNKDAKDSKNKEPEQKPKAVLPKRDDKPLR
jgi:penicillin-binding protein 1A